ncbi:MAG: hypothetical protein JNG88_10730 [Phycisphaerales bacterium]|nr:hypothetical protein [Phycisphaerales bacterium]
MPYQHLDPDAKAIVDLSNQLAHDDGIEFVGTEHILMAIIRHEKGAGARVLRDYGLTEDRVRATLEAIMQAQKEDTWVFGRLPGSPHFRNVMALAIDEATQMESGSIGSEHLLLALLREKDSAAYQVLTRLGVTLAGCRERVLKILSV